MVIIPKEGGYYRDIGLVEVLYNLMTVVLNRRFTASITLHGVLHGFRAGCGIGPASLEAKLPQELMAMIEKLLYTIVLDLHKEYDVLDRYRYLEILEGCEVGPWACCILRVYWYRLQIVSRVGGYYGSAF